MQMHLQTFRAKTPTASSISQYEANVVHGSAEYGYHAITSQSQQIWADAPPPHEARGQSSLAYGCSYRQYLGVAMADHLRGQQTAWASTSTLAIADPYTSTPWRQEQNGQYNAARIDRSAGNAAYICPIAQRVNQGAALCDRVATRLNDVLSRADCGAPEEELVEMSRGLDLEEGKERSAAWPPQMGTKATKEGKSKHSILNVEKTWMYQNSRLPPGMVPFNVYLPTWTLICRAAQASAEVYTRPPKDQRENYTDADPKRGTKATVVKSQPVDDRKLLIVAIRGSQWKFVDWTVNIAIAPTQPRGFLDDEGNACHAGFLEVAKAMVQPVAAQLRRLIEEDPSWCTSSLILTGHSAGGAVASLLYAHMLSSWDSELTALAGVFKRIHCITFGVPPISLLPLQIPRHREWRKNQFLSFVNEGDPVVRADRQYVFSLVKLFAEPAPDRNALRPKLREKMSKPILKSEGPSPRMSARPYWPVPEATLSNAGRMVLLREKVGGKGRRGAVEATQLSDPELRKVVFGDVQKHSMVMYQERLEALAFAAISGRSAG